MKCQLNSCCSCFFLHVLGVAFSSRMQNDNLVKSVITGKKDIYI